MLWFLTSTSTIEPLASKGACRQAVQYSQSKVKSEGGKGSFFLLPSSGYRKVF
jgi:hypothetical protein